MRNRRRDGSDLQAIVNIMIMIALIIVILPYLFDR